MSNTHTGTIARGKDLWVKPYTNKNLTSSVYSWDKTSKKLFRKKEKAVLKAELIKEVGKL